MKSLCESEIQVETQPPCFEASTNNRQFHYFTKLEKVRGEWDVFAGDCVFLQSRYLLALENYPPKEYSFAYCFIKEGGENIGIVYFQLRPLDLAKSFQEHDHGFSFKEKIRQSFLGLIKHQLLINGNVLLTGPYGYAFKKDVSEEDQSQLVCQSIDLLIDRYNKKSKLKIKTTLVKDFVDEDCLELNTGFNPFQVQPSMFLSIKKHWNSIEDYLLDIKSKYKVRFKRARKKYANLETHLLSHPELVKYSKEIFGLFLETAGKADFNLFDLNPDYFEAIHESLGDDMLTYGVFEEGKLIAFYTLIKNAKVAEAHFLGYSLEKNRSYQLYQNMLYNMLSNTIELGLEELNLSRTALEIKSSIGAKPVDLKLMTKNENKIVNSLIPFFLKLIVPQKEWEERNPFKEN